MDEKLPLKNVMTVLNRRRKGDIDIKHNWHGFQVNLKPILSKEEADAIPFLILEKCKLNGESVSAQNLDFVMRTVIVSMYTNIELPTSEDDIYTLVYDTDIFSVILGKCNKGQLDNIIRLVGLEPYFVRCSVCQ